ncbi:MAG: hypothetical protein HQL45_14220 [Alphaproteobacteria bacterium]|nr:hypothetical protein [Alphaproteobacteria bacterium]
MPVELSLPQAKPWYKSLTIQGIVLALAGAALPMFGIDLPPEQLAAVSNTLGVAITPEMTHFAQIAVGGVLAIIGRARAKGPLTNEPPRIAPAFLIVGLALPLSACAGGTPWSKQDFSGITHAVLETEKDANGNPFVKSVRFTDGKEKQSVKLTVEWPGGYKLTYDAQAVGAFAGQEHRAGVEKQVSSDTAAAVPAFVEGVGGIVKDIIAPVPLP